MQQTEAPPSEEKRKPNHMAKLKPGLLERGWENEQDRKKKRVSLEIK